MDMEELWSKTREVLRAEVNAVVYNSLLGSNNLVPALLDGDTLVLRVVMDNLKLLITNQWYSTIVRALSQVAGHQLDVEILTQEDIDQILSVINSATDIVDYDDEILSIVSDEVSAYFAGDKDVQTTANMIQSRVNLYVQEGLAPETVMPGVPEVASRGKGEMVTTAVISACHSRASCSSLGLSQRNSPRWRR